MNLSSHQLELTCPKLIRVISMSTLKIHNLIAFNLRLNVVNQLNEIPGSYDVLRTIS